MINSAFRLFVCAALTLATVGAASAEEARSSVPVAYRIDVRLDPATHTLAGREQIRWRNQTTHPASALRFHLYFNGWRDPASTWMGERMRRSTGAVPDVPPADRGSIDVSSLTLVQGAASIDLAAAVRFIAPDDDNAQDRTVLEVPLATPVAAGEQVDVDLAWHARIPRAVDGLGYISDFHLLALWYPQIGVFGEEGWNCHQFHASGGTLSDFASYDVRITVPSGWIVGATGALDASSANSDDTETHRFMHAQVRDFAWTASRSFQVRHERVDDLNVDIELLLQPEHQSQAERHFAAARTVLGRFSEWFGAYPYRRLTIVDPAWQSGAGSMAFPMLVTAGTHWRQPAVAMDPEAAIARGIASQWWEAAVAPNEAEHAWLGEGLSEYSAARIMPELFGALSRAPGAGFHVHRLFGGFVLYPVRAVTRSFGADTDTIGAYRSAAKADVPSAASYNYAPATARQISRDKTAVWLDTLERYIGWPSLQRILVQYSERFRLGHPAPADFFRLADEVSGRELSWYFDQVYRRADVFDYGIDRLVVDRESDGDGPLYRTAVVARRYGEATFSGTAKQPAGAFEEGDAIEVDVTFADGETIHERWDGRARWKVFTYESRVPAISAEIDPRRVLLVDTVRTNNSQTRAPRADVAAGKWSARWMVWMQDVLLTYAALL